MNNKNVWQDRDISRYPLRIPNTISKIFEMIEIFLPPAYLIFFFSVPLLLVFIWSFCTMANYRLVLSFTLQNYYAILDPSILIVLWRTLFISTIVTLIAITLGFPVGYFFARVAPPMSKITLLGMFVIPFIISPVVRTLSWRFFLGLYGSINTTLINLGIIHQPFEWLLFSNFSLVVGLLGAYLPFAIFPVWLAIEGIDDTLLAASRDLGATSSQTLREIVIPLAMPGLFGGGMMVFVSSMGEMVVPLILGGAGQVLAGNLLLNLIQVIDYSTAAAISSIIIAIMLILLIIGQIVFHIEKFLHLR